MCDSRWCSHDVRSLLMTVDGRITIFSNRARNHPPLRDHLRNRGPAKLRHPKPPQPPANPLARPHLPHQSIPHHPRLHTNNRPPKRSTLNLSSRRHNPILHPTYRPRLSERTITLSVACSARHSRSSSRRHSKHFLRCVSRRPGRRSRGLKKIM